MSRFVSHFFSMVSVWLLAFAAAGCRRARLALRALTQLSSVRLGTRVQLVTSPGASLIRHMMLSQDTGL